MRTVKIIKSLSKTKLVQGASKVITFHKNSIVNALVDLFPEVEFEKANFAWKEGIF
jgi:hypothetical protein